MSPPNLKVTIAGITGKLARLIVKNLLKNPNVAIVGTTRDASKLPSDLKGNPRVSIVEAARPDEKSFREALAGADVAVFASLGWHDVMLDQQKMFIDAAIAERVPRYVAGDWTIDFRKLKAGEHEGKEDMKIIAAYLDERRDKIQAVHILIGAFTETIFTPFIDLVDVSKDEFHVREGGKEKAEVTTYGSAAAVTAKVIMDQDSNGYIRVAGEQISAVEIAKVYAEVYKVEPKIVDIGTFAEAEQKISDMKRDYPNEHPYTTWMPTNYQVIVWNGKLSMDELDNGRFPDVKFESVRDYLLRVPKEDLPKAFVAGF